MLGDWAEIGCNSVLNPGTVVGRRASSIRSPACAGFVPENHIYKAAGNIAAREDK